MRKYELEKINMYLHNPDKLVYDMVSMTLEDTDYDGFVKSIVRCDIPEITDCILYLDASDDFKRNFEDRIFQYGLDTIAMLMERGYFDEPFGHELHFRIMLDQRFDPKHKELFVKNLGTVIKLRCTILGAMTSIFIPQAFYSYCDGERSVGLRSENTLLLIKHMPMAYIVRSSFLIEYIIEHIVRNKDMLTPKDWEIINALSRKINYYKLTDSKYYDSDTLTNFFKITGELSWN